MNSWEIVGPKFEALLGLDVNEEMFLAWGQAIDLGNETYVRAYTAKQLDTSDENAKAAFQDVLTNLLPNANKIDKQLRERVLNSDFSNPAYERILERFKRDHARVSNQDVEKSKAINLLARDLQLIKDKQHIEYEGQTLTLSQATALRMQTKDREERETIWKLIKKTELANDAAIREGYLKLVHMRHELACEAGFANYRDYAWSEKDRVDYSPEQTFEWLEDYTETFSPLYKTMGEYRAKALGVDRYRPWDAGVLGDAGVLENDNSQDLKQQDYLELAKRILNKVSPDFVYVIEDMEQHNLIDLDTRPNKAGGNFAGILKASHKSLIVCDNQGELREIGTVFHEGGHAIHNYAFVTQELTWDKECSYEVMETMAHIFSLLCLIHLEEKAQLAPRQIKHYKLSLAEGILKQLEQKITLEHFQHQVYCNTNQLKSPEDFDVFFAPPEQLSVLNWEGLEAERSQAWQTKLLLTQPFYNIEYFIARIAALIFLDLYRKAPEEAVKRLKLAMSYGATKTLTQTLNDLGVPFPFSREDIEKAKFIFQRELLS